MRPDESGSVRETPASQVSRTALLSDWLPFLIYALLAAAIPASMLLFSFVFATRPTTRTRQRTLPFLSLIHI